MSGDGLLRDSDYLDAMNPADRATLSRITGQSVGPSIRTPADLLTILRAVHVEMLRRIDSHRSLWVEFTDLPLLDALWSDPGPDGIEARVLAQHITERGLPVGVGCVADYAAEQDDDPEESRW